VDCQSRAEPPLYIYCSGAAHTHSEPGCDSADTPTDIFPSINIPVVAAAWTYTGLNPEEMERRVATVYERALTTTVDNIEHIESTTVNGDAIVKIYLQPNASIDRANAQITAISQSILKQLPPGSLPPLMIDYNASTVSILQLGLSGNGLTEPQMNDIAMNFLRTQLVTVPGAAVPYPYGGKTRQVIVNITSTLTANYFPAAASLPFAANMVRCELPI
jgi:multidrug efflux pump subunit AcrB